MRIFRVLTSILTLGIMFGCGSTPDTEIKEPAPKVVQQSAPEKPKKPTIDDRIERFESILKGDDISTLSKFSTSEKRPSAQDIAKIAKEEGCPLILVYHPNKDHDFIPDVIFLGDCHTIYDASTERLVTRIVENGDIFLLEGRPKDDDAYSSFISLLKNLKKNPTSKKPTDEIRHGILNSGKEYVHIKGMDCPVKEFKEGIKTMYATIMASFIVRYMMPPKETDPEKKKEMDLLKKYLAEFNKNSLRAEYAREVKYFTPSIIEAVEKKKENQLIFVRIGLFHLGTRWMLRRVEGNNISYIGFGIPGSLEDGDQNLVDRARQYREKAIQEQDGENRKKLAETNKLVGSMPMRERTSFLYIRQVYHRVFGTFDLDFAMEIPPEPQKRRRIGSYMGGRSRGKRQMLHFTIKKREAPEIGSDMDVFLEDIR